jgi:hypothetical protein
MSGLPQVRSRQPDVPVSIHILRNSISPRSCIWTVLAVSAPCHPAWACAGQPGRHTRAHRTRAEAARKTQGGRVCDANGCSRNGTPRTAIHSPPSPGTRTAAAAAAAAADNDDDDDDDDDDESFAFIQRRNLRSWKWPILMLRQCPLLGSSTPFCQNDVDALQSTACTHVAKWRVLLLMLVPATIS